MRQKDEVGNTSQKENQARGKGTWQESPCPSPSSKVVLVHSVWTVFGREQNSSNLKPRLQGQQPLHWGCWSPAVWLGTEYAKQE